MSGEPRHAEVESFLQEGHAPIKLEEDKESHEATAETSEPVERNFRHKLEIL